jgi:hypothetical protein
MISPLQSKFLLDELDELTNHDIIEQQVKFSTIFQLSHQVVILIMLQLCHVKSNQ